MRDILEKPHKVTQGTIFSNARSYYFKKNVFGLIISGRCDIENAHYHTFLYLPIIDLKTWFYTFLVPKVSKKNAYDAHRAIELKFIEKNLPIDVLKYTDQNELLSKHFNKKEQTKINNGFEKIELFDKMTSDVAFIPSSLNGLDESDRKGYTEEVTNLINNNYNGFFYLENVDYYDQANKQQQHFVIILNEVQTLPLEAANYLCDGIDLSQDINKDFKQFFGEDTFSLAISTIASPYIECIIQNYTSLFRVGIDKASISNYNFLYEE
jgi:hypothetical protein